MRMKKVLCGLMIAACLSVVSAVSASEVGIISVNFILDKADSYVNKMTNVEPKQENLFNWAEIDKAIDQAAFETDLKLFGYRQVNSNKLAYKESNVFFANFAKVQNKNFERMQVAF